MEIYATVTELFITPVAFENRGERLIGLIHIPSEPKPPVIVMCHGWTGNMHSHGLFVRCAEALCKIGFLVLRFDFRGSEHSDGDFSRVTVKSEVSDLRRALKLTSKLDCDSSKLGVLGYSLGGLIAVKGSKNQAKAMVLWAPTSKPIEEFKHIIGQEKIDVLERKGYTWFRKELTPYRRKLRFKVGRPFWLELKSVKPMEEAKGISCPVRVIHGIEDDLVDYRHSIKLMEYIPTKCDLKLIEGANHMFERPKDAQQLIKLTVDWFKKRI